MIGEFEVSAQRVMSAIESIKEGDRHSQPSRSEGIRHRLDLDLFPILGDSRLYDPLRFLYAHWQGA